MPSKPVLTDADKKQSAKNWKNYARNAGSRKGTKRQALKISATRQLYLSVLFIRSTRQRKIYSLKQSQTYKGG